MHDCRGSRREYGRAATRGDAAPIAHMEGEGKFGIMNYEL